jgi:hypothetical protein
MLLQLLVLAVIATHDWRSRRGGAQVSVTF